MKKVIIIGAGRSGTNILRDVLCQIPGCKTWPCDEINYIWRHGNITKPTDQLKPEDATDHVKKYIRGAFQKFASKSGATTVIEKTCANSLRVPFVNEIFPEAYFIHIIRDGRDVVNSARKRWKAELDLQYVWSKAKYIPLTDVPYYAFKYLGNRLYKLVSNEDRLAAWGPTFKEMDEMLQECTLEEVCAYQWQKCVLEASEAFSEIESDRLYNLRYEDFTLNTKDEIEKIAEHFNLEPDDNTLKEISGMVHSDSKNRWKSELEPEQIDRVQKIIEPTLKKFGYQ